MPLKRKALSPHLCDLGVPAPLLPATLASDFETARKIARHYFFSTRYISRKTKATDNNEHLWSSLHTFPISVYVLPFHITKLSSNVSSMQNLYSFFLITFNRLSFPHTFPISRYVLSYHNSNSLFYHHSFLYCQSFTVFTEFFSCRLFYCPFSLW